MPPSAMPWTPWRQDDPLAARRRCRGVARVGRLALQMKLSARNRLRGRVTRITSAEVISTVELDVGGQRVVATITTEAVRQLGLSEGQEATAIVKATDVMIAVDD